MVSERQETGENIECFDYDKLNGELFCRTRKTGDLIRLQKGRKKIKELYIDEKVPREERERLPLIAAGDEILWAVGLRTAQAGRPDEHTKTYLHIRTEKA